MSGSNNISLNFNNHQNTATMNDNNVTNHSKYGVASVQGTTMLILGTVMYGIYGILNRLSADPETNQHSYDSQTVMALTEACKFFASVFLLFKEQGIQHGMQSIKNVTVTDWLVFLLPALIYSITNNLDWWILHYMDPGSMQVLFFLCVFHFCFCLWRNCAIAK